MFFISNSACTWKLKWLSLFLSCGHEVLWVCYWSFRLQKYDVCLFLKPWYSLASWQTLMWWSVKFYFSSCQLEKNLWFLMSIWRLWWCKFWTFLLNLICRHYRYYVLVCTKSSVIILPFVFLIVLFLSNNPGDCLCLLLWNDDSISLALFSVFCFGMILLSRQHAHYHNEGQHTNAMQLAHHATFPAPRTCRYCLIFHKKYTLFKHDLNKWRRKY